MNARTMPSTAEVALPRARRDAPITILIAALGGEGGGVLTQWLVEAAEHAGYPVQSTSIPGVAQRTGATTYYVEIFPESLAALGDRRPVLNLAPVAGRVDLLIASELLEAVRAAQSGFVDRARTTVVTSTSRTLTNREKIAMGDGREDDARLVETLIEHSRRHVAFDMNEEARRARTVISAVMFGAIAGSGLLPFDRASCEAAIRASGKGVDASLAGFERGFDRTASIATSTSTATSTAASASTSTSTSTSIEASTASSAVASLAASWPTEVRAMVGHGVARLIDYQDRRYADLYLARLQRVRTLEDRLDPSGTHGHALTRETARFLALWMAFDDVIRVADLKTRPERYARIRKEVGARPDDLVTVHDYFKPRAAEIAGLLPARWSARVSAWDADRSRRGKRAFAFPIALRSDSRFGHLALRLAASLRRLRPASQRYASEQASIERWLAAVERVSIIGWDAAHATALCGRLIKGYGDTHARGHANLARILDTLTSDLALARLGDAGLLATAIDSARDAALADPDGKALDRDIARHGAAPREIVAKPLVFVRPKRMA
jgi:indolepyruvate ferredoxin oxidoreductase beta subunit